MRFENDKAAEAWPRRNDSARWYHGLPKPARKRKEYGSGPTKQTTLVVKIELYGVLVI